MKFKLSSDLLSSLHTLVKQGQGQKQQEDDGGAQTTTKPGLQGAWPPESAAGVTLGGAGREAISRAGQPEGSALVSRLQVPYEDVTFIKEIGKGSSKTVYLGQWQGTYVAVCMLRRGGRMLELHLLEQLVRSGELHHPNLVQLYRWCRDQQGNEYMLMEYVQFGPLDKLLRASGSVLAVSSKVRMAEQICSAMCVLHEAGVLHRDLSARNVLVHMLNPVHLKVTDFGLASESPSHALSATTAQPGPSAHTSALHQYGAGAAKGGDDGAGSEQVLPVRWCPPEVLLHCQWSEKSDVWAYGVTLWEIFANGADPYAALPDEQVVRVVLQRKLLPCPDGCPAQLYRLMLLCWAHDPKERPMFHEIAQLFSYWRGAGCVHAGGAPPVAAALAGVGPQRQQQPQPQQSGAPGKMGTCPKRAQSDSAAAAAAPGLAAGLSQAYGPCAVLVPGPPPDWVSPYTTQPPAPHPQPQPEAAEPQAATAQGEKATAQDAAGPAVPAAAAAAPAIASTGRGAGPVLLAYLERTSKRGGGPKHASAACAQDLLQFMQLQQQEGSSGSGSGSEEEMARYLQHSQGAIQPHLSCSSQSLQHTIVVNRNARPTSSCSRSDPNSGNSISPLHTEPRQDATASLQQRHDRPRCCSCCGWNAAGQQHNANAILSACGCACSSQDCRSAAAAVTAAGGVVGDGEGSMQRAASVLDSINEALTPARASHGSHDSKGPSLYGSVADALPAACAAVSGSVSASHSGSITASFHSACTFADADDPQRSLVFETTVISRQASSSAGSSGSACWQGSGSAVAAGGDALQHPAQHPAQQVQQPRGQYLPAGSPHQSGAASRTGWPQPPSRLGWPQPLADHSTVAVAADTVLDQAAPTATAAAAADEAPPSLMALVSGLHSTSSSCTPTTSLSCPALLGASEMAHLACTELEQVLLWPQADSGVAPSHNSAASHAVCCAAPAAAGGKVVPTALTTSYSEVSWFSALRVAGATHSSHGEQLQTGASDAAGAAMSGASQVQDTQQGAKGQLVAVQQQQQVHDGTSITVNSPSSASSSHRPTLQLCTSVAASCDASASTSTTHSSRTHSPRAQGSDVAHSLRAAGPPPCVPTCLPQALAAVERFVQGGEDGAHEASPATIASLLQLAAAQSSNPTLAVAACMVRSGASASELRQGNGSLLNRVVGLDQQQQQQQQQCLGGRIDLAACVHSTAPHAHSNMPAALAVPQPLQQQQLPASQQPAQQAVAGPTTYQRPRQLLLSPALAMPPAQPQLLQQPCSVLPSKVLKSRAHGPHHSGYMSVHKLQEVCRQLSASGKDK